MTTFEHKLSLIKHAVSAMTPTGKKSTWGKIIAPKKDIPPYSNEKDEMDQGTSLFNPMLSHQQP